MPHKYLIARTGVKLKLFKIIYTNLCESRKIKKDEYSYGSGLHRHHIIPKHQGGLDQEDNFTYLTCREHIIAHYLLWKLYGNVNDLRSMKMLGANLAPRQRHLIGKFCVDNKIGFHSEKITKEMRSEWGKKGSAQCIKNKAGIYNPEKRSEYASLGGKAGVKAQMERKIAIFNPKKRKEWAILGGRAAGKKMANYIWVYKDEETHRIPPERLNEYLDSGYELGSGRGKKNLKAVNKDGKSIFVPSGSLPEYLSNGYSMGFCKSSS